MTPCEGRQDLAEAPTSAMRRVVSRMARMASSVWPSMVMAGSCAEAGGLPSGWYEVAARSARCHPCRDGSAELGQDLRIRASGSRGDMEGVVGIGDHGQCRPVAEFRGNAGDEFVLRETVT